MCRAQVINEFGATRFDVAVRALRGELDPPEFEQVANVLEDRQHQATHVADAIPHSPNSTQIAVEPMLRISCTRAMSKPHNQNTERNPGVLLGALVTFPCEHVFNAVGKIAPPPASAPSGGAPEPSAASSAAADASDGARSSGREAALQALGEPFAADVVGTIERVLQGAVDLSRVEVKSRMGGRYVSVAVPATVRAPELVTAVHEQLGLDPRMVMRY